MKKSKKFVACGRRTTFDYDDSGSIIFTPIGGLGGDDTSGDDVSEESDSDSDEDEIAREKVKAVLKAKAGKDEKQGSDGKKVLSSRDKEVSKHNMEARLLSTGSAAAVAAEGARPQGGGARRGA